MSDTTKRRQCHSVQFIPQREIEAAVAKYRKERRSEKLREVLIAMGILAAALAFAGVALYTLLRVGTRNG